MTSKKSPCNLMALFLAAELLVNTYAPTIFDQNGSLYDDSAFFSAPEIINFELFPNPVVAGQNLNVTCIVRPSDSQVLIIRLKDDNRERQLDFAPVLRNETISVYGGDQAGMLWGTIPHNKSGSFVCEARNYKGLVRSRSIYLNVIYVPRAVITVDLNHSIGISYNNSIIHPAHCNLTAGSNPFAYQWTLLPRNSTNWILLPERTSTINVSADALGAYKCAVKTDAGWSPWSPEMEITPVVASQRSIANKLSLFTLAWCWLYMGNYIGISL